MKNEYGIKLDKNGYAPSVVVWPQDVCCICQRRGDLVRHEVFHGSLYRTRSKELGCWVHLCPDCHHALHNTNSRLDKHLKEITQKEVMHHYRWSTEDFRKHFGKNYLEE